MASDVALILRGKRGTEFTPNIAPKIQVKVINLSSAKINQKKIEQKVYKRYSGYPGNLKYIPLKKFMEKNPKTAFKRIVRGMLPGNKLRKQILKNLIVEL